MFKSLILKTYPLSDKSVLQYVLSYCSDHFIIIANAILALTLIIGHVFGLSHIVIDLAFLSSLVVSSFLNSKVQDASIRTSHVVFNGLLTGLLISAYILVIEDIMAFKWFSINNLIDFKTSSICTLILLLAAVWSLHITLYSVQKDNKFRSGRTQMIFYAIVGVSLVLSTYKSIEVSIISTLICVIYFLLLDLFAEQKKLSIIWLVLWTIILGSFLAFLIFHTERLLYGVVHIPMINAFSLFSLIFVMSGLLYVPIAILNGHKTFLPAEWHFKFSKRGQLGNRVQYSILLTLLFSFVAIGVVSIYQIKILAPLTDNYDFQHRFTQALLNTYVFLFLIGFVISISLSEYIRTPLIELGKTLAAVKLNKENRKIEWEGNDEIAYLISEYNLMIDQLQENAVLLAHTERDSAWREMSQQVAHEIKNPLTPMKLSLQHLEMSINNGRDNIEALTLKMCNTLMAQVENLRQIADEFSNFGSLPKANNEKISLNDIVETIHDLFRKRGDMDIRLIEPIDDIAVYADKNHLVRILNNLVKNSVQAIPSDRKGEIELKLWKEDNKAIIRVKDNGAGIPLDMQSQIFKPKFTTKSSGSGLGLAIAANMVDALGGRIYFKSEENQGTDFFVELPLSRDNYTDDPNRVTL